MSSSEMEIVDPCKKKKESSMKIKTVVYTLPQTNSKSPWKWMGLPKQGKESSLPTTNFQGR